jgi:putative flippase GtrA
VPTPVASSVKPTLLQALYARFAGLIRELGKFGVVGAISYAIDLAVFNVALSFIHEPITSKTISTVISATAAFVGNRFWTWRHAERRSLSREYGLYFFFNVVGLGIGLACLWITHYWLGSYWSFLQSRLADNLSANFIGVGLATLFRFWAYRRYVFRVSTATSGREVAHGAEGA